METSFKGSLDTPEIEETETAEMNSSMYDDLTQCVTLGYVNLTKTLIEKLKVDPNMNAHDGRIGKEGSRNVRKATWKSTLLHITCSNGRVEVLSYLLR